LRRVSTSARAKVSQSFFKTGAGQYGEGDRFLGTTVPDLRKLSEKYGDLPARDLVVLLRSKWHEERLLALLILVRQFERGDRATRAAIFKMYLANTRYINNWDLVDLSADRIVGAHLADRDRSRLRRLAKSKSLWERRIAMLSAFHYIKRRDFDDALAIAELLLEDGHDLIHKAVGWMLREIGKRDQAVEERFLKIHAARMPRTMLRYAIERFPATLRKRYLNARHETRRDV
jgi:3-methyladenine DNA glycosylase AlkD